MMSRIWWRHFHTSGHLRSVRVRFAPSPTGYIHLGGLRTALYNFLFARSQGGKFVLRIEDTDQKRLVPGAAKQLETDLMWMGLPPDESPLKGGPFGPYTQSERLDKYRESAAELVRNEHAYLCFCTDRRLESVKREAIREGGIPRYDNRCRQLSEAHVEEKKRQGLPHCIRFKLSPLDEPLKDEVCGDVDRSAVLHEGDPVILKADGYPTYHLANVVDDHLMEITHVLRGAEWLVSTPKHVLLYKAFGWTPPSFSHLPLIMNADGTKLSKRQDDIRLEYFRSSGYYPEAIVALLSLVGGGFPSADVQQTLYSLDELTGFFDLKSVTTHSSRLDMLRLDHFNQLALRNRVRQPHTGAKLTAQLSQLVRQSIPVELRDDEMLEEQNVWKVLSWATEESRIHKLDDLVRPEMAFLWSRPQQLVNAASKIDPLKARDLIERMVDWLQSGGDAPADRTEASDFIRQMAVDSQCKVSDVMKLMRSVLSGLKEGPSVGEIVQILGRTVCIRRLRNSLDKSS